MSVPARLMGRGARPGGGDPPPTAGGVLFQEGWAAARGATPYASAPRRHTTDTAATFRAMIGKRMESIGSQLMVGDDISNLYTTSCSAPEGDDPFAEHVSRRSMENGCSAVGRATGRVRTRRHVNDGRRIELASRRPCAGQVSVEFSLFQGDRPHSKASCDVILVDGQSTGGGCGLLRHRSTSLTSHGLIRGERDRAFVDTSPDFLCWR